MAHPDLFARAVTLAGGVGDVPAARNLMHVPVYLAGGASDELVPVTTQKAEADLLKSLGYRYRWVTYAGVDHVAFELADAFDDAAAYMGRGSRERRPSSIDFLWSPRQGSKLDESQLSDGGIHWTQRPDLGVGTTGAYWVDDLRARDRSKDGHVRGHSRMYPMPDIRRTYSTEPVVAGPGPGVAEQQTWQVSYPSNAVLHRVRLSLHNVAHLTLQPREAGFKRGQRGYLKLRTDGRVTVRIGDKVVTVGAGRHVIRFTA
jgi:hypothetical protein